MGWVGLGSIDVDHPCKSAMKQHVCGLERTRAVTCVANHQLCEVCMAAPEAHHTTIDPPASTAHTVRAMLLVSRAVSAQADAPCPQTHTRPQLASDSTSAYHCCLGAELNFRWPGLQLERGACGVTYTASCTPGLHALRSLRSLRRNMLV